MFVITELVVSGTQCTTSFRFTDSSTVPTYSKYLIPYAEKINERDRRNLYWVLQTFSGTLLICWRSTVRIQTNRSLLLSRFLAILRLKFKSPVRFCGVGYNQLITRSMLKSLYTSLIIPFCDLRGWRQERSQNWRRRQTIRRQEVSDVTFLTRKHSSKMRTARLWLPLAVGYTYHPGYLPFLVTYPSPPSPVNRHNCENCCGW